jgi:hypothetical protein
LNLPRRRTRQLGAGRRRIESVASLSRNSRNRENNGTLSLFEFADFVARHVARHDAQIDRTLANTVV